MEPIGHTSFSGGSAPQTPLQVGLEASEITGYIPSDAARIVAARKPIHHKHQEYCIHIQYMCIYAHIFSIYTIFFKFMINGSLAPTILDVSDGMYPVISEASRPT